MRVPKWVGLGLLAGLLFEGLACGRAWEDFIVDDDPASCADDFVSCDGTCFDTSTNSAHCGSCGNACSMTQNCVEGSCQDACGIENPAVTDHWGVRWAEDNRGPNTYDEAVALCEAEGARLPTATEVTRLLTRRPEFASDVQLWTSVPDDGDRQVAINGLAAGQPGQAAASLPKTNSVYFRCACGPENAGAQFSDDTCDRTEGTTCPPLPPNHGPLFGRAIDERSRIVHLSMFSALWECQFAGGRLLDWQGLYASGHIAEGQELWTGGFVHSNQNESLRGITIDSFGDTSIWLQNRRTTSVGPFRCIGVTSDNVTDAPGPDTMWRPPVGSHLRGKTLAVEATHGEPESFLAAVSICATRGAHLPTAFELAELAILGLRADDAETASDLWTMDVEYRATNATAYPRFFRLPAPDGPLSWADAINSEDYDEERFQTEAPFRCVTYPLAPAGEAPVCYNGSCIHHSLGNGGAQMWMDAESRDPATMMEAVETCTSEGGHLASERDVLEMIFFEELAPDQNGESSLMTSSVVEVAEDFTVTEVRVRENYTELERDDFTFVRGFGQMQSFRCMWTNELR